MAVQTEPGYDFEEIPMKILEENAKIKTVIEISKFVSENGLNLASIVQREVFGHLSKNNPRLLYI